jgi:hypothetical protein
MADSKNDSKVIMMLLTKQILLIFLLMITLMTSHIFTIPPNLTITKF